MLSQTKLDWIWQEIMFNASEAVKAYTMKYSSSCYNVTLLDIMETFGMTSKLTC